MVQFVTILLVAAAATIIPVLAAPVPAAGGTTLSLAAREPEVYERALAFEGAPLQRREVDALMDFVERSIEDALDLEQREETDGVVLEEREFDVELEELDEREVADAVELAARGKLIQPTIVGQYPPPRERLFRMPKLFKKKNSGQAPTTRPPTRTRGPMSTIRNLFKKKS